MSTEASSNESKEQLVPNKVLQAHRKRRGWSRDRAVQEFIRIGRQHGLSLPGASSVAKSIYRHETGRAKVEDPLYIELYCRAYDANPHDLFGDLTPIGASNNQHFGVRSHKFVPVYIGSEAVEELSKQLDVWLVDDAWITCSRASIEYPNATCELHLWPFGVAMFHIVDELAFPSIAQLAVWRAQSYRQRLTWVPEKVRELAGIEPLRSPYALSAYWLHSPAWSGEELDTAARILCMPRVLLQRHDDPDALDSGHAELVERSLLQDGFDHPELVPFGVKGVSLGFASWAGVTFSPLAPTRTLKENELVTCELAIQAIWSYCDYIQSEVEQGRDPVVPKEFGWRYLRAAKSRLVTARPQESSQHRSMREAILQTSGLTQHLTHAIEALKEAGE